MPTTRRAEDWDWWIASLPDLVWPAEGLGPWEPRAAAALEDAALRRLLARERRPGARARLMRILGDPGAGAALARAARRDPVAREWLAESLLEEAPARALRLLDGRAGARAALYRGAALAALKRWKGCARALEGADAPPARLIAAAALLRGGAPAAALAELEGAPDSAAAPLWLRAFALARLGRAAQARRSVERAMLVFSEIAFDPLLGPELARENLRGGRCRPPTERTLSLLAARRSSRATPRRRRSCGAPPPASRVRRGCRPSSAAGSTASATARGPSARSTAPSPSRRAAAGSAPGAAIGACAAAA